MLTHHPSARHHAPPFLVALALSLAPAGTSHASAECIGIFDSRAVAYAFFWSDAGSRNRDALVADVRIAKAAGDTAGLKRAEQAIRDYDGRTHLAVFSTAPADDALAALGERLDAIMREAGVTRLISRWDTTALAACAEVTRIDVTDRLVAPFHLAPARLRTIDELLRHEPVPLERARALWHAGRL